MTVEEGNADNPVKPEWEGHSLVSYKEVSIAAFDLGGDRHYNLKTGHESQRDKGIVEIPVADLVGASVNIDSITVGNTGSGVPVSTQPPFYTLIYIMRIK